MRTAPACVAKDDDLSTAFKLVKRVFCQKFESVSKTQPTVSAVPQRSGANCQLAWATRVVPTSSIEGNAFEISTVYAHSLARNDNGMIMECAGIGSDRSNCSRPRGLQINEYE